MHRIRAKLNSCSGASMMLALLLFLVCMTVAAVVITAASANSDRTAGQKDEQQAYLAAASALELLRGQAAALGAYTGSEARVEYDCYRPLADESLTAVIGGACDSGAVTAYASTAMPGGALGGCIGAMADAVALSRTVYTAPSDIPTGALSRQFTIEADGMPTVTVSMDMSADEATLYDVRVRIAVDGSAYTLAFTLDADVSAGRPTAGARTLSATHGHSVSRHVYDAESGVWDNIVETEWSYETTYTIATSVTWSAGAAGKGAAS